MDTIPYTRLFRLVGMLCMPIFAAHAETSPFASHAGDEFEITRVAESKSEGPNSSKGSTFDRDTVLERVIAVREDGWELEYDLPTDASEEDRKRTWQYPARVFKSRLGSTTLLNADELDARIDEWLALAELPREACGHWYFTWSAFQIVCDPQTVLKTVAAFDMRPVDLKEGAPFVTEGAKAPAPLSLEWSGPDGAEFVTSLAVDPEIVRQGNAETNVVVAEITGKPVTYEQALSSLANEEYEGTIEVSIETDPELNVFRKTTVSNLVTTDSDGKTESRTQTVTLERRLVSESKTSIE